MANEAVISKRIQEIFENMEYDKNVKEGLDLAEAWLKKYNSTFITMPGLPTKDSVYITGKIERKITINTISDQNVDQLINESKTTLNEWSKVTGMQKAKLFNKLISEIEKHMTLICQLEMGVRDFPCTYTKSIAIPALIEYLQYFGGWATLKDKQLPDYEPYGISGFLLTNSTTLAFLGMIIAPALAAGNVIIIDSERANIPIICLLTELCENVGFPKGIIKFIGQFGLIKCLLKHNAINKFTVIGNSINLADFSIAETKRLCSFHNEKCVMLVFDSADLESARDSAIEMAIRYRNYDPWAVNKIIVQENVYKEFTEIFKISYAKLTIEGPSLDVIFGNKKAGSNLLKANDDDHKLFFIPFRTLSEGVALANNTQRGWAASVWTENISLANEVTSKLKVGTIWINSHGNVSASCTFCPIKKSGKGYIGGKEGFLEYLTYSKTIYFEKAILSEITISDRLPAPTSNKRYLLYYGGGFKKSESGLSADNIELPNRKDVRNCIEVAKKGQESWNKLSVKHKGQCLRKLADNSASIHDSKIVNIWIESLYQWATISTSVVSLNLGNPAITTIREPHGVLVIEYLSDPQFSAIKLIIAAISCGNSVIVVNNSKDKDLFNYICSKCNLPSGVFNVFNNANDEVKNTLMSHQEVDMYFKISEQKDVNLLLRNKIQDISNVNIESFESIFSFVTKTKCIWSSVGESFL